MSTIKVENLAKKYLISHEGRERYTTLRDTVSQKAKKLFSFPNLLKNNTLSAGQEEFWALKNVNFEIQQGDRVGIIGRNGAGKSTLLKILSRITEPTRGRVEITGRVASLLEVGTGFHPELTGRENIFLNGAILGMGRVEIKQKFDEIVDFSGVESFLDTPVKRYSSGMYVRLAFAVAAHLEPEIMIIDEVLAVGDAAFQKKCLGKMDEVSKSGRTVLFVSHNLSAVETLCNRSVVLQQGEVVFTGRANDGIRYYIENGVRSNYVFDHKTLDQSFGNKKVKILRGSAFNAYDHADLIDVSAPVDVSFTIVNTTNDNTLSVAFDLESLTGGIVFGSAQKANCPIGKRTDLTCKIPANLLNDGIYNVNLYVHTQDMQGIYEHKEILTFEVKDKERDNGYLGKINGAVRPILHWEVKNHVQNGFDTEGVDAKVRETFEVSRT
jgi:lipopolysaccharide transport system ATP-binding protein